jgi:hypothetical protein
MESSTARQLRLDDLARGLPGITPAIGRFLAEVCVMCLDHHNHPLRVQLSVVGAYTASFQIDWQVELPEQVRNAWEDEQEYTEFGACGIAILLVLDLTPYTVIRRARKGQGIDYWLGIRDAEYPFQDAARLEVSGILAGDSAAIQSRVREKRQQVAVATGLLPCFVVIVEFSGPIAQMVLQ